VDHLYHWKSSRGRLRYRYSVMREGTNIGGSTRSRNPSSKTPPFPSEVISWEKNTGRKFNMRKGRNVGRSTRSDTGRHDPCSKTPTDKLGDVSRMTEKNTGRALWGRLARIESIGQSDFARKMLKGWLFLLSLPAFETTLSENNVVSNAIKRD